MSIIVFIQKRKIILKKIKVKINKIFKYFKRFSSVPGKTRFDVYLLDEIIVESFFKPIINYQHLSFPFFSNAFKRFIAQFYDIRSEETSIVRVEEKLPV